MARGSPLGDLGALGCHIYNLKQTLISAGPRAPLPGRCGPSAPEIPTPRVLRWRRRAVKHLSHDASGSPAAPDNHGMWLRKRHRPVRVAAVAATLLLGTATAAQARPSSLNLRQPLGLGVVHHQPGVRAQAPSPQALATSVQQAAGVPASEVTAVNVCAAPQPGHAACAAQELVLRSNHRLVHPHVTRRQTFTQVVPRHRSSAPAAAAAAAAAANPQGSMSSTPANAPSAGTPGYLQQAYDLTYLSQTAGPGTPSPIVDADDDLNAQADLATYRSTYGLPPCTTGNGCFTKVNGNGAARRRCPARPAGLGGGDLPRPRRRLGAVPQLPHPARRGQRSDTRLMRHRAAIASAQTRSPTAGRVPRACPSARGAHVLRARRGHRRNRRPRLPRRRRRQLSGGVPGRHRRRRHHARRRRGGHQHPRLYRVGVVAEQLRFGWGGGSGCDPNEPKPAYQADTGCTGPRVRRRLGRRRPRHRPASLRLRQRGLVASRAAPAWPRRSSPPSRPSPASMAPPPSGPTATAHCSTTRSAGRRAPAPRPSPTSATPAPAMTGPRGLARSRAPSSPAPLASAARRSATAPPTATRDGGRRRPRPSSAASTPTAWTPPTTGSTAPRPRTATRRPRRTSARARRR